MDNITILIVDDEQRMRKLIKDFLAVKGYKILEAGDGEEALEIFEENNEKISLVLLDVMMPKIDGWTVLRKIRQESKIPVIMLTAKSELDDKLLGFSTGANDYITKPFHMDELVARINAQLRNNTISSKDTIDFGDISLNIKTSNLKCTSNNEEINIINKEFQLLEFFMNNNNQIISKEQIYDKVWGIDNDSISNNLEAYLSFIRKKLKIIGSSVTIKSVRNLGYKMEYNNEEIKD